MAKRGFKYYFNTIYIAIRWFITLFIGIPISVLLHSWISMFRGIPTRQVYLNLGKNFFESGVGLKLNQPIKSFDRMVTEKGTNKTKPKYKVKYVTNIFFDLRNNRITPRYSAKPFNKNTTNESSR